MLVAQLSERATVRARQPPVGVTAPDRRHAGPRQGPGNATRGHHETRGITTRTEGEIDERAIRGGDGAFGSLLRARRIRSGLTQGELSRRAGVSIRALRDIEQGRVRQPRRESVERLVAALEPAPADAASPSAGLSAGPPPGRRRSGAGPDDLEIGVLGPLTVRRGGRPLDAGPFQQRCLLGLLALQPNQLVGREGIVDVLWGANPPATYRDLIHAYVARLRKVLAPGQRRGAPARVIARVNDGYQLTADTADPEHVT